MPRRWILFIILAGPPLLPTRAPAQTRQELCAALRNAWERLTREVDDLAKAGNETRDRIDLALALPAEHGPLSDVMTGGNLAMLRFAATYGLPDDLVKAAREGNAGFWYEAREWVREEIRIAEQALVRNSKLLAEQCDPPRPAVTPSVEGPLPLARHPTGGAIPGVAGAPVVTDELISRWLRAGEAEVRSGGAFWQAGRMTQQDYREVTERIRIYTLAACTRRSGPAEEDCVPGPEVDFGQSFTPDELAAFGRRRLDLANALRGNWSAVPM